MHAYKSVAAAAATSSIREIEEVEIVLRILNKYHTNEP